MLLAGDKVWGEGNGLNDRTDKTPMICNPQMSIVMPLESHSSTAFSHRLGLYYDGACGPSLCYEGYTATAPQCPHLGRQSDM